MNNMRTFVISRFLYNMLFVDQVLSGMLRKEIYLCKTLERSYELTFLIFR